MSRNPASLQETQATYEQRFSCVVCFSARFDMVGGQCQHRVCANCLYDKSNALRKLFLKCPVCQYRSSFPLKRPEIPEDNMEMMRCLGVRSCPNQNRGCPLEMWEWELEEHSRSCEWKPESPPKRASIEAPSAKKKKPAPVPRRVTRSWKWLRGYSDYKSFEESAD